MTREELARQKGLAAEIIAKYHGNLLSCKHKVPVENSKLHDVYRE